MVESSSNSSLQVYLSNFPRLTAFERPTPQLRKSSMRSSMIDDILRRDKTISPRPHQPNFNPDFHCPYSLSSETAAKGGQRIVKSFCFRPLTDVLIRKSNAPPGGIHFGSNSPLYGACLLYTSPSPRDGLLSRMPSSA